MSQNIQFLRSKTIYSNREDAITALLKNTSTDGSPVLSRYLSNNEVKCILGIYNISDSLSSFTIYDVDSLESGIETANELLDVLIGEDTNSSVREIASDVALVKEENVTSADETTTALTIQPNKMYVLSGFTEISLTLGSSVENVMNKYMIQFTAHSNGTTLNLPYGVVWSKGVSPTITSGYIYQITIYNGIATYETNYTNA